MEAITVDVVKAEELTTTLDNLTLEIGKIGLTSQVLSPIFTKESASESTDIPGQIPVRSTPTHEEVEHRAAKPEIPFLPKFGRAKKAKVSYQEYPLPEMSQSETITPESSDTQPVQQPNPHKFEYEQHTPIKTEEYPSPQPEVDIIQFNQSMTELISLAEQAKAQIKQGSIEKDCLFRLNAKLAMAKANYGHIAAIAVALAAVISGIKDLIELFELMN
ncbi:hypothetical protein [Desmospora activa]|uniref:Uncharacterized protein n=1 Tax=Desmospora activa DSM 45169 TaxID=1121389 RepID=A0A2T4Z9K0_9BACL|nr:hypothetical protein [Desmospora activa]PTM58571.1 hypothetical protein C8J48_1156 [Desmospora activa DSM 45169]